MVHTVGVATSIAWMLWVACGLAPLLEAQGITFEQVDKSSTGVQGNGWCTSLHVSGDGRIVAFNTNANNLVPGDTNGAPDGFVRDLFTGTTEFVCLGVNGQLAVSETVVRALSEDGRFVAFISKAANLHPDDTDAFSDVYVRDRWAGTTELISVLMDSTPSVGDCLQAAISADGRYVAFQGGDPNFVPGDTNGLNDVFVRDRFLGTTTLISVNTAGTIADRASGFPSISADGRKIVFRSNATNLHPSPTGNNWHAYLRDLDAGVTLAIDLTPSGLLGNEAALDTAISADGSMIAFESQADDLLPGDVLSPSPRAFTWRPGEPLYALQSCNGRPGGESADLSPSADGRYVAFEGGNKNWVAGDPSPGSDIFLHDTLTLATNQVSSNGWDQPANNQTIRCSMSDDGRVIGFLSQASNLVPGTTPGMHAFVRISDPTPGLVYCSPSLSPTGCLPVLVAGGAPSASAGAGHLIAVTETLNDQVGLFVYSKAGSLALPFGAGWLCVGVPFVRLPAQATGGAPPPTVDCSGALSLDFNTWIAGGQDAALAAGSAVWLQSWTRDPTSANGALLSEALAFVIGP